MNIQDCCVGLKGVVSSIHKVTRALSGTTNSTTISSAIDEVATAIENGGGGSGGTTDHTKLINRNSDNQHPINAIDGLSEELDSKQDKLISGRNIITINNQSLLDNGDLDVSDIFIAQYKVTTYLDILSAVLSKLILVQYAGSLRAVVRSYISDPEIILTLAPNIDLEDNEIECITFRVSNEDGWSREYGAEYYQEELTSGTNIKTINNISILGSGNIDTTILESPNGTPYKLKVANDGTLSTEVI